MLGYAYGKNGVFSHSFEMRLDKNKSARLGYDFYAYPKEVFEI